jgi:hypothetical protein
MVEAVQIAKKIMAKIEELETMRQELKVKGQKKAEAIADYEKQLAKILIRLRNHDIFTLDGNTIHDPPVSIMEKVAKGLCWREALDKDVAETRYKSLVKEIDVVLAQMNGLQSINRYLDNA